jgi:hypothetical protein
MFAIQELLFQPGSYTDSPFDVEKFKKELILRLTPFIGMNVIAIAGQLGVEADGKESVRRVSNKMMKYDETKFRRAHIYPKIFIMYPNAPGVEQHMSLAAFHYKKIQYCEWQYSALRHIVEDNEFLFLVFENKQEDPKRRNDRNIIFKKAIFHKMTEDDIEEVRAVYERTCYLFRTGIKLYPVVTESGKIIQGNNLPHPTENPICHVRPHGDPDLPEKLPDGRTINQQSFWLNSEYIMKVINKQKEPDVTISLF